MSHNDLTFEEWMKALDLLVLSEYGVSIHDLADQPFRAWFDDDMAPGDAFDIMLEDSELADVDPI